MNECVLWKLLDIGLYCTVPRGQRALIYEETYKGYNSISDRAWGEKKLTVRGDF